MSENSSFSTDNNDTSSSSSTTDANDSSSAWKIEYKTSSDSESKGVWDGYDTKEEFLMMHLR